MEILEIVSTVRGAWTAFTGPIHEKSMSRIYYLVNVSPYGVFFFFFFLFFFFPPQSLCKAQGEMLTTYWNNSNGKVCPRPECFISSSDLYSFSQRKEEKRERRSARATHCTYQIFLDQSFQKSSWGTHCPTQLNQGSHPVLLPGQLGLCLLSAVLSLWFVCEERSLYP